MEGPSVRAVADHLKIFMGKPVISVSENARIEKESLRGERIKAIFSRGKQLVIQFPERAVTIHFLMFGSYRISEAQEGMEPRLTLAFDTVQLNFYNCSVRIVPADQIDAQFDEERDILASTWNAQKALARAAELRDEHICDVLLDQNIFAGVFATVL